MEKDVLQNRWHRLKGLAREFWGELTGDEVEFVAGRRERLVALLEEKYGMSNAEAEDEVDRFLERY